MFEYKNRNLRIGLHILFWVSYLLVFVVLTKLNNPLESFVTISNRTVFYSLPVDILATYFTIYILLPKLFYKGRYFYFGICFILSLIIFILILQVVEYYIAPIHFPRNKNNKSFWDFPYFLYIVSTYSVVVLAVAIKLGKRWIQTKARSQELEKQNLKSELTNLKHQIGPHFLFNTLNNIDSLVHQDQDKASMMIIKLSDIMRYMLYDSQHKMVPLEREIEYIRNLIDLQTLRTVSDQFIEFELIGNPEYIFIPPLLFVPFIENAIKHGGIAKNGYDIYIQLKTEKEYISFNIINIVDENRQKEPTGGIGLNNVKRRLALLFPNEKLLFIDETEKHFKVRLLIPINKNKL